MGIAREYLDEIGRRKAEIDRLRKEIDDIRTSINLLPGVKYDGDHVQTSTTEDRVLRAVEALVDKERKYADLIKAYHEDRFARIMTIFDLTGEDLQRVLTMRYVDGLFWWEIMRELKCSESTVHRLHRDALDQMDEILRRR